MVVIGGMGALRRHHRRRDHEPRPVLPQGPDGDRGRRHVIRATRARLPDRWLLWPASSSSCLSTSSRPASPAARQGGQSETALDLRHRRRVRGPCHRMGRPSRPALVMWHGLARTGRDSTRLRALSSTHFVITTTRSGAASRVGRRMLRRLFLCQLGAPRLPSSSATASTRALGRHLDGRPDRCHAHGAGALQGRITGSSSTISGRTFQAGTGRIASMSATAVLDTIGELEMWLRTSYAPFGNNTDAFWRRMRHLASPHRRWPRHRAL